MMFSSNRPQRFILGASVGAAVLLAATMSFAQMPQPVHVRGEVVSLDGAALTVKPQQGQDVTVHLADKARVVGIVPASAADIKPGVYIGTTTVQKTGSGSRALEVHIFPEALRGAGEGDRPWDLEPGSSMTNGSTENPVDTVNGKTITVTYKGGKRTVTLGPDTVIVTYARADKSDLKPGAKVFVSAQKAEDGTLQAQAVAVGKGVAPPM